MTLMPQSTNSRTTNRLAENMRQPSPSLLPGLGQSQPDIPANTASVLLASDVAVMSKRYEQFMLFDQEKSKFMSDLITHYEYLHQQHQIMNAERTRERTRMAQWQTEKLQYETWYKSVKRAMVDNPFIMVLIDGDGMIFRNEFLCGGEAGGRRAACQLYAAIQAYTENETNDVPLGAKIVCRIYANVRGLADVLVRTGAVQSIGQFQDFVRGFTRGKTLFDFVDVGAGKDRADEKIIESFKLYSQDHHCRRLLFGCSHDNGYARALEECSDKVELLTKVVLLEGVPFEKELVSLPYNTKKFPDLFRDTKITVRGSNMASTALEFSPSSPKTPATGPLPVWSLMDSPVPNHAFLHNLPRTPSPSTVTSEGFPPLKPQPGTMHSWAQKAAAPAPLVPRSPVYKPANREEVIARNRAGQRIDSHCKDYDKTEVERVKKLKLCNIHFLRKECPYDRACTHVHSFEPTKNEICTLRLIARMSPCQSGSGCQDIKCIYGHRCPAPLQRTKRSMDTKPCIFGDTCKFASNLHEIDTNVVKTLVIR